jgi:hypothetical protein
MWDKLIEHKQYIDKNSQKGSVLTFDTFPPQLSAIIHQLLRIPPPLPPEKVPVNPHRLACHFRRLATPSPARMGRTPHSAKSLPALLFRYVNYLNHRGVIGIVRRRRRLLLQQTPVSRCGITCGCSPPAGRRLHHGTMAI